MRTRLAILLAALLLGLGLAQQVTLSFAGNTALKEPIEAMIAAFEKENPSIRIRASFAPIDQLHVSLRTQLAAGNAPDIFSTIPGKGAPTSTVSLAEANYLLDLSAEPWAQRIPSTYDYAIRLQGKTYGMAPSIATIGILYNKQVFQELNLRPPRTWNELLAFCDTVKKANKIPFAMGYRDPWVNLVINFSLVATLVYSSNPRFDVDQAAGRASFVTSPWKDALQKHLEMEARGCFNPNPTGTSYQQMMEFVATGRAAATVTLSLTVPQAYQYNKEAQLEMVAFPATNNPNQTQIPASLLTVLSVYKNTRYPEQAKAFIRFITEPRNLNRFVEMTGDLPLFVSADSRPNPVLSPMIPYINQGRIVPFMDHRWPNAEVQQALMTGMQQLLTKQATIEQVLRRMDEAYNRK